MVEARASGGPQVREEFNDNNSQVERRVPVTPWCHPNYRLQPKQFRGNFRKAVENLAPRRINPEITASSW
jgi:hypothetical protein